MYYKVYVTLNDRSHASFKISFITERLSQVRKHFQITTSANKHLFEKLRNLLYVALNENCANKNLLTMSLTIVFKYKAKN